MNDSSNLVTNDANNSTNGARVADRSSTGRGSIGDRAESIMEAAGQLTLDIRRLEAQRGECLAELADEVRKGGYGKDEHAEKARSSKPTRDDSDFDLEVQALLSELSIAWRQPYGALSRLLAAAIDARDGVRVGTATVPIDEVRHHWRSGTLDSRHVEVIASNLKRLQDPSAAPDLRDRLLTLASEMTPMRLEHAARRLRAEADPTGLAAAHQEALEQRHVAIFSLEDGMAMIRCVTDAVSAVAWQQRLRTIAKQLQTLESDSPSPRTLTQIEADVMSELLTGGVVMRKPASDAAAPHGADSCNTALVSTRVHANVHVTVPATTLMELDDIPAELDGYGPIDADTARRLIAESVYDEDDLTGSCAGWHRILTHPVNGIPLKYDRSTYSPPAALRRLVQQRDGTCRFPGCIRPAKLCDIDHTHDWQFQGKTNADNLACLCRKHHTMKHHTDWTVEQAGHGTLHWTTPIAKNTHTTTPRQDMPATRFLSTSRSSSETVGG